MVGEGGEFIESFRLGFHILTIEKIMAFDRLKDHPQSGWSFSVGYLCLSHCFMAPQIASKGTWEMAWAAWSKTINLSII